MIYGIERGIAELENSNPRTMPQRNSWLQSRQEIALREKGYRKGDCGTGKQQFPGQCPREIHGCKADRKLLCVKKGIGRGIAELENSNSPDNAPEKFMAAKQTGNCSA